MDELCQFVLRYHIIVMVCGLEKCGMDWDVNDLLDGPICDSGFKRLN